MDKKILVALGVIVWLVLGVAGISFGAAVATDTPQTYKVSITKLEISNDGGSTYITLFEGASDYIDIASVSAGQAAGNFFAGLSVPDGTYTHVRATPSATFKMKGSVSYSGTTYYTIAGGSTSTTAADMVEATINVQGTMTGTAQTLSPAITVKNGVANHKVRIEFNVSNTLGLWVTGGGPTYGFFPEEPSVTLSVH